MPNTKEKTLYVLKTLTELVENDQVRLDEIRDMTAVQIIERAEVEAEKAKTNAHDLANTPDSPAK